MSERKVLNKYYPPDYDPSKLPRIKKKDKPNDVRLMAPFNMRCNTCGDYIGTGTKFNAKKDLVEDETYNELKIFRIHIKCKRCMAPIIIKTNPRAKGYEIEKGATENFRALKLAEQQARDEAEAEEEAEKIDPMKQLESRTKASRQQMEASEQIRNIRAIKHKMHSIDIDSVIQSKRQESIDESQSTKCLKNEVDDEIKSEALKMLKRSAATAGIDQLPAPSAVLETATKKKKIMSSSLADLKRRINVKAANSQH